ncbi:MAG: HEAT repeat domain-containing protein [Haloarculaceae archaeon]
MTDAETAPVMDIDPDEVTPGTVDYDAVRAGFHHEEGLVKNRAADVTTALAEADIDAVDPLLEDVIAALEDDNVNVVKKATAVLSVVAEEDPDRLEDAVGPLVRTLDHDLPLIQTFAVRALRPIAMEHPEWFGPHVGELADRVEEGRHHMVDAEDPDVDQEVRQTLSKINASEGRKQLIAYSVAANLIVEVAEVDPDAVLPHVDHLVEMLDDVTPVAAGTIAEALGRIARDDPEAVAHAVDPLTEWVDYADEAIAGRVIRALGYIGDPAAAPAIRAVAEDEDRDEDLRDLARETADFLETVER